MINILMVFVHLFFGSTGWAQIDLPTQPGDSKMTKIENASLICADNGVLFAIDSTPKKERVWQGDVGMSEGIEINIREFHRLDCCYSFSILGQIQMMGQKVSVALTTYERQKDQIKMAANIGGQALILDCAKK